ncbi:SDR family oxidoreductase [Streptomyces sp. NPDC058701]|uniref:SDR family oxidoreductase n=1 Tax=Streptomyces sp. NPDC058701 TaxID=3346608 RepID=UPI00366997F4
MNESRPHDLVKRIQAEAEKAKSSDRRSAIVTGGTQGIGYGLARLLGEMNYTVTVVGRDQGRSESGACALRKLGCVVSAAQADFSSDDAEEQIDNVVEQHSQRFGRLDLLVNSAGVAMRGPLEQMSTKRMDVQLDVNLRSLMLIVQRSLPMLRHAADEHGRALIVNVASVLGTEGRPQMSSYVAAKHGVVGFTRALNCELSAIGVQSVAICPGLVDTSLADLYREDFTTDQMIPVEDVAETLRYLLRVSPRTLVPEVTLLPSRRPPISLRADALAQARAHERRQIT